MKIETIEVSGLKGAMLGMRNPLNSWEKSDSKILYSDNSCYKLNEEVPDIDGLSQVGNVRIGEADLKLAKTLSKAGSDHGKYLRMIHVQCNITAPTYWIAEHDTYKVATIRNSCSFMHKGVAKEITLENFSTEEIDDANSNIWKSVIAELNRLREKYLETKGYKYFRAIRQLLPSGWEILYTWDASYETLKNIYHSRKNHKLEEWHTFCDWIETLPYSELITITKN